MYIPISQRNTNITPSSGYVPVAKRKPVVGLNVSDSSNAFEGMSGVSPVISQKQTEISQTKPTFLQSITSKLPEPIRQIGQDIKEGLIGGGQQVDIAGNLKQTKGLITGLIQPFGLGKTTFEKITERGAALQPLVQSGKITAQRADELAKYDVLPRGLEATRLGLPVQPKELTLTESEKTALRPIRLNEAIDKALGSLDYLNLGTLKPIGKKVVQKIAESTVAEEISGYLLKELPGLEKKTADVMGEILRYVDNTDDVQKVLNRTEFELSKLNKTKVASETSGETPLLQEAKKYKSAEEITSNLIGESDRANISDILPKEYLKPINKLYRGQKINGGGGVGMAREGLGLYTVTDKKVASGYAKIHGKEGVLKEMSVNDAPQNPLYFRGPNQVDNWILRTTKKLGLRLPEFNEQIGINKLVNALGYDGVAFDLGNGVAYVKYPETGFTKSQLTDIWNKAQEVKTTYPEIRGSEVSSRESGISSPETGNIPLGQQDLIKTVSLPTTIKQWNANVKVTPAKINKSLNPPAPKIVRKEDVLLREKLKNQAKGAKFGYKAGQLEARTSITNKLRGKIEEGNVVRSEIVDYVKNNIPIADRGVFLNMVKDAKTQTDLIKAFSRIDRKSTELSIRSAITNLRKTVEKLTDSNAVSADYRNKIKEILSDYELSGHTQATIDKLQATRDYIKRQESIGEDVEIPKRVLDKLSILDRTPKNELTLSQIEGLQNEIELLGQLGKTKWASKQALYEGEKELRKEQLLNSATSINSKKVQGLGLEKSPPAYVNTYIKARNFLQKTRVGLTPIEGLADITGMQPMKAVLDLNFGNYLTYNDRNIKDWYELTKEFDELNFKRIGAYAVSRQSGGMERLANSGITQDMIDNLNLTPEELKAYDFVRERFDAEFPAVKKYALDVYNKDVGEVKNYVSFMSDNNAMNELEMYDRFGSSPEFPTKTKTTEQGYLEKRSAVAETKLELNIDKIFRRHMDDVAYMLTMGRDIKQYFEIVNSDEMREKLGDVGSLAWLQYLDLMARKGGSEGAKRIAFLDIMRKNLSLGVLSFRLSSAVVQFTSFADTMGTIGAEWAMKGASDVATSKEWRNFVMDNFPEVAKAVGDDIAFREFGEGMLANLGRIGMIPLQTLDGLMRSTTVVGAYQKLAIEKGILIDLKNPDKGLIQDVTRLLRYSQGSSFFKDQPLSVTTEFGLTGSRSFNKTVLTFQSFMLARWDNLQRQIWRLGIKEGNYKKAGMSFFWMVIVAAAMEEGLRRGVGYVTDKGTELVTGKKQEEKNGSFLSNSALNVIQAIPIAGQLVSSLTYASNPVPVINTIDQMIEGGASVWGSKTLNAKLKGGLTFAGSAGSVLGLPGSSYVTQLLRGLVPSAKKKKKGVMSPPGSSSMESTMNEGDVNIRF